MPEYCHMKVDGKFGCWNEGRCLLFDDFLLHSAQNEGEATEPITTPIKRANVRVVLLLDLWHPQLGEQERRLLSHIFRYCRIARFTFRKRDHPSSGGVMGPFNPIIRN